MIKFFQRIKPAILLLLAFAMLVLGFDTPKQTITLTNRTQVDTTCWETGALRSSTERDLYGLIRITEYYKDGAVRAITPYQSGVLHGTIVSLFPNGDTMCYWQYNYGQADGRALCYYEHYKPAYEQFFKDGYKSGTWTYYEENGDLRSTETYLEGTSKAYDSHDFSLNTYYWQHKAAFTVSVQNGKHVDTVIVDPGGYAALMPKVPPTGKQLFLANCASCHHPTRDATGPMLKGIAGKREQEWLIRMIRNGQELINNEDPIALALYQKWGKMAHPDFTEQLDRAKTLVLIGYLKTIK